MRMIRGDVCVRVNMWGGRKKKEEMEDENEESEWWVTRYRSGVERDA